MPLYYNSSAPTHDNKNSITKTATDFGLRDFLLHKNIQNPIKYPQLQTSINGSPKGGEPVLDTMIGNGDVIQHVSIEVDGIFRYDNAIIMNHYKNIDSDAGELISIENNLPIPVFPTSPTGVANYQQEDITKYGLLSKTNSKNYRQVATLRNLYVDAPKQIDIADIISLQPTQTGQQITSYLDNYGNLNLGGSAGINASDVIGSVLNGQGLGLAKNGLVTNYDIRSSLAGRVLSATGLINDTKLGIIGGQQLALALANNAAFNAEQLLLGKLNVSDNILSLFKNGTLAGFRPDYKITVPSSTGGKVLDYSERILGFTVPRSYLNDAGSIFFTENGNIGNIERANEMILTTGKGQVNALLDQMTANLQGISPNGYDSPDSPFSFFRTGYAPGYKNTKGEKLLNPKGYVYMDAEGLIYNFFNTGKKECIPEISYKGSSMIEKYGFDGLDDVYGNFTSTIIQPTFSWISDGLENTTGSGNTKPVNSSNFGNQIFRDKKTLLGKTQMLFNSIGMKTIVSVKGDMTIGQGTQLQSAVVKGGISKGSAVMKGSNFNADGTIISSENDSNPDNVFCRSWTTYNRYDTVNKLIRHKGINTNENDGGQTFGTDWRLNYQGSVLGDNGFVQIAPYKTDDLTRGSTSPKKYMFSIENLAWAGAPAVNLLPCEQGPGDLLSGKFGRIMWFPPYDLQFSETSSVNIEATSFIGRGEPVYTYNNTERTGNLSFKVIVDHPSIMNAFQGNGGPTDEFIRSWFAGCVDLDPLWANKLTTEEKVQREIKTIKNVPKKVIPELKMPDSFRIYFKNDRTDVDPVYESTPEGTAGIGPYQGEVQTCKGQTKQNVWPDQKSFGLNLKKVTVGDKTYNGWIDPNFITGLVTYLSDDSFKNRQIKISVLGFASTQGCEPSNTNLASKRAANTVTWLKLYFNAMQFPNVKISAIKNANPVKAGNYSNDGKVTPEWEKNPKSSRYSEIRFEIDQAKTETEKVTPVTDQITQTTVITEALRKRFYTECDMFEKIKETDPFVYDKIREKIKFFSPAFHSITPEGFNSRLTFLNQCTRQGPTISGAEAKNLAFGPPPVCILRIGDFYNTKIFIDNLNIDYEEPVWDLNPEGIGVQPMIAKVNISFKYIGGSTLYGPINKLQNALSFNYYANTHVYDPRADYIAAVKDIPKSDLSETRKTFMGDEGQNETNYALVPGTFQKNTAALQPDNQNNSVDWNQELANGGQN